MGRVKPMGDPTHNPAVSFSLLIFYCVLDMVSFLGSTVKSLFTYANELYTVRFNFIS